MTRITNYCLEMGLKELFRSGYVFEPNEKENNDHRNQPDVEQYST